MARWVPSQLPHLVIYMIDIDQSRVQEKRRYICNILIIKNHIDFKEKNITLLIRSGMLKPLEKRPVAR